MSSTAQKSAVDFWNSQIYAWLYRPLHNKTPIHTLPRQTNTKLCGTCKSGLKTLSCYASLHIIHHHINTVGTHKPTTCNASKSSRLEFTPKDSCFILSKTSSSCVHLRIHVDVDLRCIGEEMHIISMKHFVPSTTAIKNMRLNWRCDSWMWIILGAKRANLLFDMRLHNFICLLT